MPGGLDTCWSTERRCRRWARSEELVEAGSSLLDPAGFEDDRLVISGRRGHAPASGQRGSGRWRRPPLSRHPAPQEPRRSSVGSVPVGGDAPITVQSMTNTLTADAAATIDQIRQLEAAGADIVRVSCPDEESTAALPRHRQGARRCRSSPTSTSTTSARIEAAKAGAACLRINPGNIGSRRARARSGAGGPRPWLLHAHRRQRRLAGARPAGEVRRALPRGDGRERAATTPASCRTTTSTSSRSA